MTRRILITGGATGIGLATAHAFLPEEPELVLVGRRRERLDAAVASLQESGGSVVGHSADLSDPAAVQELADELAGGAPFDVLVLNAGGNHEPGGEGLAGVAADWRSNFEANVLTAVLTAEALLDRVRRPGGRIVATSSVAGVRGGGSYGAAKAAINAWVWWMSGQLAPDQITVNAVAPGFVPETAFWTERIAADPDIPAQRLAGIPMQRPGTVEEVAAAVRYLASPEAGWTTGQILGVNGGAVLGR